MEALGRLGGWITGGKAVNGGVENAGGGGSSSGGGGDAPTAVEIEESLQVDTDLWPFLRDVWTELVQRCAENRSSSANAIKRYVGDTSMERQRKAMGGDENPSCPNVSMVLRLVKKKQPEQLSDADRAQVSTLLQVALDMNRKLAGNKDAAQAALNAVKEVYGAALAVKVVKQGALNEPSIQTPTGAADGGDSLLTCSGNAAGDKRSTNLTDGGRQADHQSKECSTGAGGTSIRSDWKALVQKCAEDREPKLETKTINGYIGDASLDRQRIAMGGDPDVQSWNSWQQNATAHELLQIVKDRRPSDMRDADRSRVSALLQIALTKNKDKIVRAALNAVKGIYGQPDHSSSKPGASKRTSSQTSTGGTAEANPAVEKKPRVPMLDDPIDCESLAAFGAEAAAAKTTAAKRAELTAGIPHGVGTTGGGLWGSSSDKDEDGSCRKRRNDGGAAARKAGPPTKGAQSASKGIARTSAAGSDKKKSGIRGFSDKIDEIANRYTEFDETKEDGAFEGVATRKTGLPAEEASASKEIARTSAAGSDKKKSGTVEDQQQVVFELTGIKFVSGNEMARTFSAAGGKQKFIRKNCKHCPQGTCDWNPRKNEMGAVHARHAGSADTSSRKRPRSLTEDTRKELSPEVRPKLPRMKSGDESDAELSDYSDDEEDDDPMEPGAVSELPRVLQSFVQASRPVRAGAGAAAEMQASQPVSKGGGEIHPKQMEVAEGILAKIQAKIETGSFTQFVFAIQVPDLNSLCRQTIRRLDEFIFAIQENGPDGPEPRFFPRVGAGELVYKPGGAGAEADLEQWKRRIVDEPKTLFLFIHDEAHYQATLPNSESGWKSGAANKWINDDVIRLEKNVATLFVSATPYNLLSKNSQVPEENMECWFDKEDKSSEGASYYGLKQYKDNPGDGNTAIPGCITADEEYERAVQKRPTPSVANTGIKNAADRRALVRRDVLFEQYAVAMAGVLGRRPCGDDVIQPSSSITQAMMSDLLKESEDGKGIMILLRVNKIADGEHLRKELGAARDFFGLQNRFAIVLDVEETKKGSLRKCIDVPLQDRMAGWQGCARDELRLESYSDLNELPCILILCEKGKMGDTFPPSLRYYDLRLRYANSCNSRATAEQDLGRGFRYVRPGEEKMLPTIMVGPACLRELGLHNTARRNSLWEKPDDKIKKVDNSSPKGAFMPKEENDFKPYRENYEPLRPSAKVAGHFDSQADKREQPWRNNPNRFLLVGLPQIGKTGAFLHLIHLLWEKIVKPQAEEQAVEPPDIISVIPPEPPEHTCICHPPPPNGTNMEKYPCFSDMERMPFRDHVECPATCRFRLGKKVNDHGNCGCPAHAPGYGKYGDPKVPELWEHNVVHKLTGCHPSAHMSSSASASKRSNEPSRMQTSSSELGLVPVEKSKQVKLSKTQKTQKTEKQFFLLKPWSENCPSEEVMLRSYEMEHGGSLHIPARDIGDDGWWSDSFASKVRMNTKHGADTLKFPIFMPTYGRAATGHLDLRKAMRHHISLQPIHHLQILVVKPGGEYKTYREKFPQLAIYELPEESLELGIGDARFCIQQLADQICPAGMMGGGTGEERRFCFVLDDSTSHWVGMTLPDDPLPMFGKPPMASGQYSEVSLGQVLLYLQAAGFADRHKFGVIGFHRRSYGRAPTHAFAHAHVFSAVLLNIDLLKEKDVHYDRKVRTWEDIDFNRRASKAGLVICKGYRFQQVVVRLDTGGCSTGVARQETPRKARLILLSKPSPKPAPKSSPAPAPPPAPPPSPAREPMKFRTLSVEQVKRFTVTYFRSETDAAAESLGAAIESEELNGFTLAQSTVDDLKEFGVHGFRATKLHAHVQQALASGLTPDMNLHSL